MSTLAVLVGLLLILVIAMVVGALAYAVYRRPVLTQPVLVALTAVGSLVAIVGTIVTVGARCRPGKAHAGGVFRRDFLGAATVPG
ncbi:hypothetical protein ABT040_18935 [Streptomyces sp. NPDC002688]|uniref:hypothetical protein n=1 Tax=Streptomyces sp. NPDC002688 TaxID=3154423 RepID=UPI00332EA97E